MGIASFLLAMTAFRSKITPSDVFLESHFMVIELLSRYSGEKTIHLGYNPLKDILLHRLVSVPLFLVISYFAIYFYIDTSHKWVKLGSGITLFNDLIYYLEIPFAVLVSLFLFFPSIKNLWLRNFLPIVPILVLYGLVDGFFNYMERSPHFSDFQNFNTIFEFSFELASSVFLFASLIPLAVLGLIYGAAKVNSKKQLLSSLSIRTTLITLLMFFISTESFNRWHEQNFHYTVWSEEDTLRENGKFSSFIYYSNQERINQQKLSEISADNPVINIQQKLYSGTIKKVKNIHMIVLESFIDPRLIQQFKVENSVLASEIMPFLNHDGDFSHVISPIYGGGTAQAEFELLTGLKALSKVNQIEFNVMKGGAINSFVRHLERHHYHSIATIGPSSSFFNSRLAYQSLGFSNIEYLQDDMDLNNLPDDGPLFDGDLLEQNLTKVKLALAENNGPIFNYVLGMYGHLPFRRDEKKRPDVVSVEHEDDRLRRISNQFYYRTRAIAQYLKDLIAVDENAIIYITSDHLPSILGQNMTYKLNNKVNIALFINQGQSIDVSGKKFYQIPWLIWDLLTETVKNRNLQDDEMERLYYQALSESLEK